MFYSTIWFSVLLALSATAYRLPSSRGGEVRSYVAVTNQLGYRLQRVQSYQSGNQLFSPYGISKVLSVLYQGTSGQTQQQLGHLGYRALEQQGADISQSNQQLRRYLQRGSGESQLEEATALLYPSDYSLSSQYQQVLESSYQCLVQQVQSSQRSGSSVQEINRWIQEQTRGKMSQIVEDVDASSGLALLNGIYYEGLLQSHSEQGQVQQLPFYNEGETSPQSVSYYQIKFRYPYYQDEQLQAVQLPYQGGEYSLLVVLPAQQIGVRQLQQQVSYGTIQRIIGRSQQSQVRVSLPQFRLDYSHQLEQDIQSLGVTSIFGSDAQLSGVSSSGSAYVSQIYQRAVVEVGGYGARGQGQYGAGQQSQYSGQQQYQYGVGQEGQYKAGRRGQYGQEGQYEGQQQYQYGDGESQFGARQRYQYEGQQQNRYGAEAEGQYEGEQQSAYAAGQEVQYEGERQYRYRAGEEGPYGGQQQYEYRVSDQSGVADFRADRPFLFYVIHKQTGLNLLAGRVSHL